MQVSPPILGNTSGNIIIASFYDYNCGYCKKGDKFINQLIELNSEVRVVLKPLPILGDTSYYASSIALAVYKMFPSKFQIIHDNLIEMTSITRETVEKLLTDNNLDPLLITEEASKEEIRNIIKKILK